MHCAIARFLSLPPFFCESTTIDSKEENEHGGCGIRCERITADVIVDRESNAWKRKSVSRARGHAEERCDAMAIGATVASQAQSVCAYTLAGEERVVMRTQHASRRESACTRASTGWQSVRRRCRTRGKSVSRAREHARDASLAISAQSTASSTSTR